MQNLKPSSQTWKVIRRGDVQPVLILCFTSSVNSQLLTRLLKYCRSNLQKRTRETRRKQARSCLMLEQVVIRHRSFTGSPKHNGKFSTFATLTSSIISRTTRQTPSYQTYLPTKTSSRVLNLSKRGPSTQFPRPPSQFSRNPLPEHSNSRPQSGAMTHLALAIGH
jgi:hypothetical protein